MSSRSQIVAISEPQALYSIPSPALDRCNHISAICLQFAAAFEISLYVVAIFKLIDLRQWSDVLSVRSEMIFRLVVAFILTPLVALSAYSNLDFFKFFLPFFLTLCFYLLFLCYLICIVCSSMDGTSLYFILMTLDLLAISMAPLVYPSISPAYFFKVTLLFVCAPITLLSLA